MGAINVSRTIMIMCYGHSPTSDSVFFFVKIKTQAYRVKYNAEENGSDDLVTISLILLLWFLSFSSSFMTFWLVLNLLQVVGCSGSFSGGKGLAEQPTT